MRQIYEEVEKIWYKNSGPMILLRFFSSTKLSDYSFVIFDGTCPRKFQKVYSLNHCRLWMFPTVEL